MSTVKLLNREHAFDSQLAALLGSIEKAVLLKNISYWVEENERHQNQRYFRSGRYWTQESLDSLSEKYPYMKRGSIGRWMQELARDGWVLVMEGEDKFCPNFYTFGSELMLFNSGEHQGLRALILSQNETQHKRRSRLKMRHSVSQNEIQRPSQNETQNNVNKEDVDLNVELLSGNPTHTLTTVEGIRLDPLEENFLKDPPNAAPPPPYPIPNIPAQTTADDAPSDVELIVARLNEACGTHFRSSTKETQRAIKSKLKDGYGLQDFETVIAFKAKKWKDDPKMREYLRPETLFNGKFESYLEAARLDKEKPLIEKPPTPTYQRRGADISGIKSFGA